MPTWWLIKAEYDGRSEVVETCNVGLKVEYVQEFLRMPQCRVSVSQREDFLQPWKFVEILESKRN